MLAPKEFWTLNDTRAGTAGRILTPADGADYYAPGLIGKAWHIDGQQNRVLQLAESPFTPAGDYTVSAWLHSPNPSAELTKTVISLRDATTPKVRLYLSAVELLDEEAPDGPGNLRPYVTAFSTSRYWERELASANAPQWIHLVLRYRAATNEYALTTNGQHGPTYVVGTPAPLTNPNLVIGGTRPPSEGASTAQLTGSVEAIGVWDTWLGDADLATLYNAGAGWEPQPAQPESQTYEVHFSGTATMVAVKL